MRHHRDSSRPWQVSILIGNFGGSIVCNRGSDLRSGESVPDMFCRDGSAEWRNCAEVPNSADHPTLRRGTDSPFEMQTVLPNRCNSTV